MIGGENSFGQGHYDETELGEVLPVSSVGLAPPEEAFSPRLTEEGKRHPVTALAEGGEASARLWGSLPPIPGLNLVKAKPGARVLLEHPLLNVAGHEAPVLVVADEERGRSMALMTDSSWLWSFPAEGRGLSNRYYEHFWNNAIRWLVRDPDLTTLQVTAEPPSVEPGTAVGAVVTAREPDYQPAAGAAVTLELSAVRDRRVVATAHATTGPDGTARVSFPAQPVGAYRVHAVAKAGDRVLGEGEDAVAVRTLGPELTDASVRMDLLSTLARDTGGKAYRLPLQSLPDLPLLDPPIVEVGRSRDRPLWDRWEWLLVLATALGLEWVLRRRYGYI